MLDTIKAENRSSLINQPFAIIGMACRLPGAPDTAALWDVLRRGESTIAPLPENRFPMRDYWHPRRGEPGKFYATHAGTLDNVSGFDTSFFGMSTREARQMDPQQRLLLELAWEAMEDAGKQPEKITDTGVYIGASSTEYANLRLTDPSTSDGYFMTGNTLSIFSNRISYLLGLNGPSLTIDTACSSSLFALHNACTDLALGRCDAAFVGGVNMLLSPYPFIGFCAANMLSPTGQCHSFGADADGYVRSEGGVMLLIRPLEAALKDGDAIHAVILGSGVNSDGRTPGLSYPSKQAQTGLLRSVYGHAGISPDQLSFIEAHGTGTPAGDPVEAAALGNALGQFRQSPLPIGSVKSNVGHLEPASGLVSIVKTALALQHRILPRSLHARTLNPDIPFEELNLAVAQDAYDLPDGNLVAGVNNFGFGGANAHFILGSPPPANPADTRPHTITSCPPLLLSARSTNGLHALARQWLDMPLDNETIRGAATRRSAFPYRLAIMSAGTERMHAALDAYVNDAPDPDFITGQALSAPRTIFVFSGNGTQFPTMGRDLLLHSPEFAAGVQYADTALRRYLDWSVEDVMRSGTFQPEDPEIAQPLLFAFQVGILHALKKHGMQPDAVVGHSVGEIAAAYCAGILALEEAARIVVLRSRHQAKALPGSMAAVQGEPAHIQAIVAELSPDLDIAAYNAPGAVTLAGSVEAIDTLERRAGSLHLTVRRLPLAQAYHSHLMEPVATPLLRDLGTVTSHAPRLAFVSTVTGESATQPLTADYWWRNVRQPVHFEQAINCALGHKPAILVEIAPRAALQYYMRAIVKHADIPAKVMAAAMGAASTADPFPRVAASFYVAGGNILNAAVFSGPARIRGLPGVQWQRTTEWYEPTDETLLTLCNQQHTHPLLSTFGKPDPTEWIAHLDTQTHCWLNDHVVSHTVVLPAACLIEFAFTAARSIQPNARVLELRHFEIFRPVVLDPEQIREIRMRLAVDGMVTIESRPRLSKTNWTIHAQAQTGTGASDPDDGRPVDPASLCGVLDASTLYHQAQVAGLDYGPHFQRVGGLHLGPDAARVDFVGKAPVTGLTLDPTALDGVFQGLIGLAIQNDQMGTAPLPRRIGRIRLRVDASHAANALIRVTMSGPRETQAAFCMHDDAGQPILSATGCWFTRMPVATPPALCERSFHERWRLAPLVAPHWPDTRFLALRPVLEHAGAATQDDHDAKALIDAFLASHDQKDGDLRDEDAITQHTRIWQSLFLDFPQWLPAALLASWLDERARTDAPAAPADTASPDATIRLLLSGRAVTLATRQLFDAIAAFASDWPADRPLRVLELHADRGVLTRELFPRLFHSDLPVDYTVMENDVDHLARLRADLLPRLPGIIITDSVEPANHDIIVSFAPGLNGHAPSSLLAHASALVPGGILLVCEAAEDMAWRQLRQHVPNVGNDITAWRSLPHRLQAAAESVPGQIPFPFVTLAAVPAGEPAEAEEPEQAAPLPSPRISRPVDGSGTDLTHRTGEAIMALAHETAGAAEQNEPLLIITRDAQTDPVEAARAVLARTIANEYPALSCRRIDVAGTLSGQEAEACIQAEYAAPDQDTDVRWDTTGRHVRRLYEGLPPRPLMTVETGTLRLVQPQPGPLGQLRWVDCETVLPKGHEVAIRVQASGLNYRDVLSAIGLLPDEVLLDGFAGATLGMECAGVIEAVGTDVIHLVPGQRVMALASAAHASRVVTDAASVMPIPDDLSVEDAATIPVAFLTALHALETVGQIQCGETVLIHGAAGGVGLAAIQYALHVGTHVIATAGTAVKRAALRNLGVVHVFDSRSLSFADDVMRATNGEGVDLVLNALSGLAMERSLELVRPFGRFLELGKRDFLANSRIGLAPLRKNVSFHAIDIDALVRYRPKVVQRLIGRLRTLLEDGALGPLPRTSFAFADAQDAFALMRASGHVGKVILTAGPVTTPPASIASGEGTVIITGGTGGFAGRAAVWLARQGTRHIALLSRRGNAAENSAALRAELLEAGAHSVTIHACDIADETQLENCLNNIRTTQPPITGVMHAAAVVSDGLLSNLSEAAVRDTLGAKLRGAINLDRLTRTDALVFFMVFSSATITLGAPGQGAYEAANAAAEALMQRRHAEGLPGNAVRWGPIADAGLLERNATMRQALDRRLGVRSMQAAMALADLPALMACDAPNPVLADMHWGATAEQLPILHAPLFSNIPRNGQDQQDGDNLATQLASATEAERLEIVTDLLQGELVRIMQADRASLSPEQSLTDLGMDSLTAMELVLGLERQLGVTLPGFAWQDMTINRVARQIVGVLGDNQAASQDEKLLTQHLSPTEQASISLVMTNAPDTETMA